MESIEKRNKSANQIERELGYPRNALNNYKSGREPSGSRLIDLSYYFDVTPEYLLGREKKEKHTSVELLFEHLSELQKVEMLSLCHKWELSNIKKHQNLK